MLKYKMFIVNNTKGFSAVPGWDPVIGLGTPKFPEMFELFMSLP